jgi:hypothetical protein
MCYRKTFKKFQYGLRVCSKQTIKDLTVKVKFDKYFILHILYIHVLYIYLGGFMSQLNIHMTPLFENQLLKFMKLRHISTKAEAIRVAVKEGLEHSIGYAKSTDFSAWLGLGKQALTNKKMKFHSDDDLWK